MGDQHNADHPRVFFRTMRDLEMDLREGFLCLIDGQPWLAATLEEARSRVPATMRRMKLESLEEQTDVVSGERYYLYRDVFDR